MDSEIGRLVLLLADLITLPYGNISARLEESGRILIPAAVRRKLHLTRGSEVLLHVDDTGIQIGTREQALARVQNRLRKYMPHGRILSQELLAERRQEAAQKNPK